MTTLDTEAIMLVDNLSEPVSAMSLPLAARALHLMRKGQIDQAWLWADRLCRTSRGATLSEALLLRAAILSRTGDRADAQLDLELLAEIDPVTPALNRILLASPDRLARTVAARRLLRATRDDDRSKALLSLAQDEIRCVGMLELSERRLIGRMGWNGSRVLNARLRTDVLETALQLQNGDEPSMPGFRYTCRIDIELPQQAQVASLAVMGMASLIEPSSLLLPPVETELTASTTAQKLLIVIPVYDNRAATIACIESLLASLPTDPLCHIVVVDDVSPDPALSTDLAALAAKGHIELLQNTLNLGFAGSINRGLQKRGLGQHALLLNADTIVPHGAIERLARHVVRNADIGTVTPLSNNGEDTSFPKRFRCNPLPNRMAITNLQTIAASVNDGQSVEMPNGVGFCLYIRGEILDRLGPLSHAYGRGYYEDVDLCLRAAEIGFKNVCATDVYVGHHGSLSFNQGKRELIKRNLRRISTTYPNYLKMARAFAAADPLRHGISRIEEEALRTGPHFDLLVLASGTPSYFSNAVASNLTENGRRMICISVGRSGKKIILTFTNNDGSAPQNMIWKHSTGTLGENEISQRLSCLPVHNTTVVNIDGLPPTLVRALKQLPMNLQLISISGPTVTTGEPSKGDLVPNLVKAIANFASPASGPADDTTISHHQLLSVSSHQRSEYRIPQSKRRGDVLAVIGMPTQDKDIALLKALVAASSRSADYPAVVVVADLKSYLDVTVPDGVHVSGKVEDADLPAWLSLLGPRALFFADRDWSLFDPRVAHWAAAGLFIAYFDGRLTKPHAYQTRLALPVESSPAKLGRSIQTWLSRIQT